MYDRSYGAKYAEPKDGRAPTIAKLMRMDIRKAILAGELPGKPSNYRVRSHTYSMGQSIYITAVDLPGMYQICEGHVPGSEKPFTLSNGIVGYTATCCSDTWCKGKGENADSPYATEHAVLTVEGRRVLGRLEEIHRAYNHDGSDLMTDYFDVRYYGVVTVEKPPLESLREASRVDH